MKAPKSILLLKQRETKRLIRDIYCVAQVWSVSDQRCQACLTFRDPEDDTSPVKKKSPTQKVFSPEQVYNETRKESN